MADFDSRKLTWAALLGRWVEFARSAVALPDDAAGRAMRQVVPDIISLQALTLALGEAETLDDDELALALDRARLLIEQHTATLEEHFPNGLHPMLAELLDDAQEALQAAEDIQRNRDA
ncbi:MAG: hypothetical protein WD079_05390 [Phycisphaeraceae bacterium]